MPAGQLRTQIRHQRILDAALTVFSRRGYHDTAVDDIASEADTSKGGIYFHFPGKQAIFLALLDAAANLLFSRIVERLESEADPVAKLDGALQVLLQTFGSHRVLARLFLVEAPAAGPEFHAKLNEIHGRFITLIKENLDEAAEQELISDVDTQVAALAWFGALNEVVVHWILEESDRPLMDAYLPLRLLLLRSIGVANRSSEVVRKP